MNILIKYYFGALLTLVSDRAAAEAHSIQHEIEVFFSSGVGSIVFIFLLLLLLLLLLLPLAVFGLKRKLKDVIRESQKTNKILADIQRELATLSTEETPQAYTEQSERAVGDKVTADLYDQIKFDP
jgi:hypothetical protein